MNYSVFRLTALIVTCCLTRGQWVVIRRYLIATFYCRTAAIHFLKAPEINKMDSIKFTH